MEYNTIEIILVMDILYRSKKDKVEKGVARIERELEDRYGASPIEQARKHIVRHKEYEKELQNKKNKY